MGLVLCGLTPFYAKANANQPDEAALLAGIFPSGCHFSGRYSQQKTIQGVPVPLISTGDFYYSCDLGLIWHTKTPFDEAILYVNSSNNFKAEADGTLAPLSGTTRYIMSNIFVRLLKGETSYFTDEFTISKGKHNGMVELQPESDYIRQGLNVITVQKNTSQTEDTVLEISVIDASSQLTEVAISDIKQYDISGKRAAFAQCEALYSDMPDWCQVLRFPSRF